MRRKGYAVLHGLEAIQLGRCVCTVSVQNEKPCDVNDSLVTYETLWIFSFRNMSCKDRLGHVAVAMEHDREVNGRRGSGADVQRKRMPYLAEAVESARIERGERMMKTACWRKLRTVLSNAKAGHEGRGLI